ncbi:hypothetical protein WJX72_000081 [[Myrmecia] bisecta]|uniref:Secreted protein n=1 Tax=[Myrmecia] bisecta TaxID=41462 RepID=A0AAW1P4A0_9CHLO
MCVFYMDSAALTKTIWSCAELSSMVWLELAAGALGAAAAAPCTLEDSKRHRKRQSPVPACRQPAQWLGG